MSQEEEAVTALMVKHINAWNNHDLEALMQLFAKDGAFEASGGPDVEGQRFEGETAVRAAFSSVFDRMPDAHWGGGRHYVINTEYCVSEWTLTGTLADGSRLEVNGCDFLTVKDGLIKLKNSYRKQRPPIGLATS